MRYYIALSLTAILLLIGCNKSDEKVEELKMPNGLSYSVNSDEQTLKIALNSIGDWKIYSHTTWCAPVKISGNGNDTLKVQLEFNIDPKERFADITIKGENTSKTIRITQSGYVGEYNYKLPIVFHVLYNNPNDTLQNITARMLYTTLSICNVYYKNSTDMKLELVAATHDPEGQRMSEPGINRIQWHSSDAIDHSVFMSDPNMVDYLWDPNNYINVFIYPFTQEYVLGISYFPYTISANSLEGLYNGDYYLQPNSQLTYPHCISLNNEYAYAESYILNTQELPLTLSHEVGHYLGLFHVFDTPSDYCDDTETYDRNAYEEWLETLDQSTTTFETITQRETPQRTTFISYNIMDYDYSYLNRFTPDQKQRVRHVLYNSPLIPGPKKSNARTKSTNYDEIPQRRTIQ